MSSRNRASNSSRNAPSSSRLRMDRNPVHTRITDPSLPATKRREIDNVMKKARASTNGQWDKKLLEVEERDPNRWRHTGYKAMYLESDVSSENESRIRRSRSRSRGRARSPVQRRRTPPQKLREPQKKLPSKSRRPPSPTRARSPRCGGRSPSGSSVSSCSDDSCSVCSPKTRRNHRSRSRSFSVPRSRGLTASTIVPKPRPIPPPRARPASPPPKTSEKSRERRKEKPVAPHKVASTSSKPTRPRPIGGPPEPPSPQKRRRPQIDVPRPKQLPAEPTTNTNTKKHKERNRERMRARVKVEGSARQRPASPESSASDSSDSITSCPTAATRLTLSERFGKMAQWSIDRRDIENMRITKDSNGGELKVMIEEGYNSPRRYGSPAPPGHYPEELAATGPMGLSSWDDVRVRYDYYKGRGYLRDLDLQDYVKWEEWWYRYQDWLKQERYYEQWQRNGPRRRRKRVPITQRLH